jgi:GNAT superfamily N-acetyltransferase
VDNNSLTIHPVTRGRDLDDFIRLPVAVYRNDPSWIPPLWSGEKGEYTGRTNPALKRSERILLLVRRGPEPVARVVFYADPRFNEWYASRTAFFGSFECREDFPEAAAALLAAGERWCRDKGYDTIRGPINPVAESWGMVTAGFDRPPVFLSPHNRPAYNRMLADGGYVPVKDLLVYEADARKGYRIPERFTRFTDTILKRRPELTLRRIDRKHLMRDGFAIGEILNRGVADNWGFVPVAADEMAAVIGKLKPFLDPDAVWFVEDAGRPVGCCLGFPDINILIRKTGGRLFPTGWLTLLAGVRRVRDYRLWGLALLPEYQGQGLDVLLYERLFASLAPKGVRLEANYILEDNLKIRNALEKLDLEQIKRYRVYEKGVPHDGKGS